VQFRQRKWLKLEQKQERPAVNRLLLALGANISGVWGEPRETLARACDVLAKAGLRAVNASHVYATPPLGPGRQAPYLNAVVEFEAGLAPAALLRLIKQIERRAGRRFAPRWSPRCLDLDILDIGSRRLGWPPPRRRERGRLILPHPEMHRRAFVLVPLLEVAPHWRHPALGVGARLLLAGLRRHGRDGVRQSLDLRCTPPLNQGHAGPDR
jgi:2-amino-4-hydroxy-6-hydroxymethyldihydropteridine diphosphokinase